MLPVLARLADSGISRQMTQTAGGRVHFLFRRFVAAADVGRMLASVKLSPDTCESMAVILEISRPSSLPPALPQLQLHLPPHLLPFPNPPRLYPPSLILQGREKHALPSASACTVAATFFSLSPDCAQCKQWILETLST